MSVTKDARGHVFLADGQTNAVWKIDMVTGSMVVIAGTEYHSGQAGDGGPATSATFRGPEGIRFDHAGNLYVVDSGNFTVRKVDVSGVITTVAGTPRSSGYTGDGGPATSATLGGPSYLAFDQADNLYISDTVNNVIRRVDAVTHIITTFAGNGTAGFTGDAGAATSAELNSPFGIVFDSMGNLFISDRMNHAVRKVAAATGFITTIAGIGGSSGSSGDGGPATSAELNSPWGITVDSSNNLYIADFFNGAIRKVDAATQTMTTVAGILGSLGYSGDGGAATSAQLDLPSDVYFDNLGNLFICDIGNATLRQLEFQAAFPNTAVGSTSASQNLVLNLTGNITINSITVPASQGGNAEFGVGALSGEGCNEGSQIAAGAGLNCGLAMTFNPLYPGMRRLPLVISAMVGGTPQTFQTGIMGVGIGPQEAFSPALITTVAGNGTLGYTGDGGPATSAEFQQPFAVALDFQGNLYISDTASDVVRRVDATTNFVTTIAGNGSAGYSGDGYPAAGSTLSSPAGISLDARGDLYISDSGNQVVRNIDAVSGVINTFAGNGSASYTGDGGSATSASLSSPADLLTDNIGDLIVSDFGNNAIRRVDANTGIISTVAGNGTAGYSGDGALSMNAVLGGPNSLAIDVDGDLYISDSANNVIRKISAGTSGINTIAGNGSQGFGGDGSVATSAMLHNVQGLAVDAAGNLYLADSGNNVLRRVNSLTQVITTFAGDGTSNHQGYSGDSGAATAALLNAPAHPAIDNAGNIYFADTANGVVRKISGVAPVVFASTFVGQSSPAQDVTITNTGNTSLAISGLTLPADFNLSGSDTTCTATSSLAPAGSCVLGIVFAPTTGGSLSETLTVIDSLGSHPISVSGSGVQPTGTTTALTVSPNSAIAGQSVTFTATVSPAPSGFSTGTVSFFNGEILIGTASVNSSGVATFSISNLEPGAYTVAAIYSGNTSFATSASSTVSLTVNTGVSATTTTIASSPSAGMVGMPVTLTATISPAPSVSPAGTVSFYNGEILLGTAIVDSTGTATFSAANLEIGTYNLTAVYSGCSTLASSTSPALSLAVAAGFTVTAPPNQTIPAAGSADVSVTVPSLGGNFNLPVTLSASGLPAGATATFNPPVVTPGVNGALTVMTIHLSSLSAAMTSGHRRFPLAPMGLSIGLCGIVILPLKRLSKKTAVRTIVATLLLAATVMVAGCGGGFSGGSVVKPGNYVITITGSNGALHASTNVTIVIE